jgi:hypothetical protein
MAGLAKGAKVGVIMCAAVGDRLDMMDFLGWNVPTVSKAALAKRMLLDVQVTDGMPTSTVNFVRVRAAAVLVVLTVRLRSMDFAVPVVGQVRTAGVSAGLLGFIGHG